MNAQRGPITRGDLVEREIALLKPHARNARTQVPVLMLEGLSEADRRAYIIADNRLAELAGWDRDLLGLELGDLSQLVPDFDLGVIGFDVVEIESLMNGLDPADVEEEAAETVDEARPLITRSGDMWQLGKHRLICGDSTRADVFEKLMMGEVAQMAFTDAPYNVRVNGHICGLGKVKHDEFVMASGEMIHKTPDYLREINA